VLLSASVSNSAAAATTSAADTASSLLLGPARLSGVRSKLVEACILDHLQPLSFPLRHSLVVYLRKLSFRSVVATSYNLLP
jgi:hypothetical protein